MIGPLKALKIRLSRQRAFIIALAVGLVAGLCSAEFLHTASAPHGTDDTSAFTSEHSAVLSNLIRYANVSAVTPRSAEPECGAGGIPDATSSRCTVPSLPDVETMLARLILRLEGNPDDVAGWRTLGWSYFNTGRFEQAAQAYERAVQLTPDDAELKAAHVDAIARANSAVKPDIQ